MLSQCCHNELMNSLIVNADKEDNDREETDVPESKLSLGCWLKMK